MPSGFWTPLPTHTKLKFPSFDYLALHAHPCCLRHVYVIRIHELPQAFPFRQILQQDLASEELSRFPFLQSQGLINWPDQIPTLSDLADVSCVR